MRPVKTMFYAAMLLGLGGCSGAHDAPRDRSVGSVAVPEREVPGLNVPSLLALSIDELNSRVGPRLPLPAGFTDPGLAPLVPRNDRNDSTAYFQCRGLALVASYDHGTGHVSELLLLGGNESELMRRGQLLLGAEHYLVLPVFQEHHPTRLLGLRVLAVALNQ